MLVTQLVIPTFVRLVPEITRSSCHRGEVPDLKHNELYPGVVSLATGYQCVEMCIPTNHHSLLTTCPYTAARGP